MCFFFGVQSVGPIHQGECLGNCGRQEQPDQEDGAQVEEHGGQPHDGGDVETGKGGGTLFQ